MLYAVMEEGSDNKKATDSGGHIVLMRVYFTTNGRCLLAVPCKAEEQPYSLPECIKSSLPSLTAYLPVEPPFCIDYLRRLVPDISDQCVPIYDEYSLENTLLVFHEDNLSPPVLEDLRDTSSATYDHPEENLPDSSNSLIVIPDSSNSPIVIPDR